MEKKMVIKVHITSQCCKKKLLQVVSKLQGIDKMEIDSEKNTMTVIGTADPMDVIKRLRKVCKSAEIVTIGPPAQPKPAEPPKPKPAEPSKPKPAEPSKPAPCPSYPPVCFSGCPWNCTACVPPRYIACHEETPQFCTLM